MGKSGKDAVDDESNQTLNEKRRVTINLNQNSQKGSPRGKK